MKGIPREVVVKNRKITNSREIRLLRKDFSLNNYQQSILIGSLLGDGGLYSDGWNKNYRLVIDRGEKQKDYLFWKFEVFSNCCFSKPSYQKHTHSWRMRTISHKDIKNLTIMAISFMLIRKSKCLMISWIILIHYR